MAVHYLPVLTRVRKRFLGYLYITDELGHYIYRYGTVNCAVLPDFTVRYSTEEEVPDSCTINTVEYKLVKFRYPNSNVSIPTLSVEDPDVGLVLQHMEQNNANQQHT